MIEADFEDDTHYCLKCHTTIIGLENYVNHRKNNCFNKTPTKSNLLVESTSVVQSVVVEEVGEPFGLKADDFFSSLELQSSSKKTPQTTKSTPTSVGILTRSKTTGFTHQPKTSGGKNVWIGGHETTKQFDDSDTNQTKLIKAVDHLERRKEVESKNIDAIYDVDSPDDDSDDFGLSDELSDEEAPPRNHTGGKWKPSSPIYWKNHDIPPPSHTGGKWKPISANRRHSPPPNHTKGKWKPCLSPKEPDDIPPPTFTGSKWTPSKKLDLETTPKSAKEKPKPKWSEPFPPLDHTKGKWPPIQQPSPVEQPKNISPNYTKGKWLPTSPETKLNETSPLRKSSGIVQYWCQPCNRHLASKKVYERHVKSELHHRRTLLECDPEDQEFSKEKEDEKWDKLMEKIRKDKLKTRKRVRRRIYAYCNVCRSKIKKMSTGKHLISHYHCQRGNLKSHYNHRLVLNNIQSILQQSPFQCAPCKYYFNFQKDFLDHWTSKTHLATLEKSKGTLVCTFCQFTTESNDLMYSHLISEGHLEVVSVINRSVPIVIRKMDFLSCGTCQQKFTLNIELKKHAEKLGHTQDLVPNIKCDYCPATGLKSQISLQRHLRDVHQKSIYICGVCDLIFKNQDEMKIHRGSSEHHHAFKDKQKMLIGETCKRKCYYCELIFDNFTLMKAHVKESHPEHHSKCSKCGLVFTLSQDLTMHIRKKECHLEDNKTQNIANDNQCEKCLFTTESESELIFHKILHSEPLTFESHNEKMVATYQCTFCEQFFVKNSLLPHLRTHTKERPFICNQCGSGFVRLSNLVQHVKLQHGENPDGNKQVAGRSGLKKGSLKIEVLGNERPFLCSTCGASFAKKFCLQQHMTIHNEKIFLCIEPNCTYAGRSLGELNYHFQSHGKKSTFKCDKCDYVGKTKQQLRRHKSSHDEIKKFKCPQENCSFSARDACHLKRHIRLHTGSKPFKCPHCLYKCNNIENLRKHVISTKKHPGKCLYECKFCPKQSKFKVNFSKDFKLHLMMEHGEFFKCGTKASSYISGIYEAKDDCFLGIPETFDSDNPPTANRPPKVLKITQPHVNASTAISNLPSTSKDLLETGPQQPEEIFPICVISKDIDNWSTAVECYEYNVEESGSLAGPFNNGVEAEEVFFNEIFMEK